MTRKHPDANLTLRQAFDRHYDKSEVGPKAMIAYQAAFKAWARLTGDPPICEIDLETIAAFRTAALKEFAPATVRGYWTGIRAVLRRVGPAVTGNPRGLGIITLAPWMRPVRVAYRIPKRVNLEDISRFYVACSAIQFPRSGGHGQPPAEWWRLLIVLAFCTGLRKSDLLNMQMDVIDLEAAEVHFTARKTDKEMLLPLHPVAVEHLRRLWSDRQNVFPGMSGRGGDFTWRWHEIAKKAGVDFTLHDLRRTACSEVDRVQPGLGAALLQHRPLDVTGNSYLSKLDELREAIHKIRLPIAFKHGPKQADRQELKARAERERMMKESEFRAPTKPDPSEWKFRDDGNQHFAQFWFRGQWRSLGITQWRLLKALALSPYPVDLETLVPVVYGDHAIPDDQYRRQGRVCGVISKLRDQLRIELGLHRNWNPVPCLERGTGVGGKWTLCIPANTGRASA